ncbi:G-protein coupled receptor 55 [Scleropages formosus]|uniref:G protein-coupled receptor 35, tandem duplicate 1 n=1 Tax=Scleropages formosus TaxID=113540 RepID=A0A8C9SBF7_SCLFO|nr:G-protein coupled receptor 55-like [Scleropages formosus]XP_018615833.2 G-protein coupled receptor 55-like [Scleropages formosus]XP_018615841.2 G-protein coupled receptor 55-like [Scleropages formosus]XP_018615849.2 G-protein coupled receptor 55-like [Scleropages formosus]XP_018615857.2 G-protein coupled receptor 55-like [Scleropages formosus]
MKMTNCSQDVPAGVQIFYIAVGVPTFIFGLLVNVAFLVALCYSQRNTWTYMMVYIVNMAFSDTIVLIFLPVKMYSFYNQWNFVQLCLFFVSSYFVNMYVSIFTVTAISVVRYVAIKYPFRALEIMSPRKAVIVCVLIWLTICSLSYIFHFVDSPGDNATNITCFQKIKNDAFPLEFILVLEIVGFLLPLIIMSFCSIKIVMYLYKKTDISSASEKTQCIGIIITNLIVFILCFTPLHLSFLFKFLVQTYYPGSCQLYKLAHSFVHIATCISHTNCCFDVFSYYFLTSSFWKRLSASFQLNRNTCCFTKNSVL